MRPAQITTHLVEHEPNYSDIFRFAEHREIGIGYAFNSNSSTHHYVFFVGSRPNELPITIVDPNFTHVRAETVSSARVQVWISDEQYDQDGSLTSIGSLEFVRISESPDKMPCPTSPPIGEEWSVYRPHLEYVLQGAIGPHTVYVQMCDAIGDQRSIVESTVVVLTDDRLPIALFAPERIEGPAPFTVAFTNNSQGGIQSYEWDFDTDGQVDSTEENAEFTFVEPGVYRVVLTAHGANETADSFEGTVIVNESEESSEPTEEASAVAMGADGHSSTDCYSSACCTGSMYSDRCDTRICTACRKFYQLFHW
jgi:plastocyanin